MNILIVEDNTDDRKLLRQTLEHHGCTVIEARDGEEGLDLAKRHHPDIIVSDALMPRMDGFQLLRALKSDPYLNSIPFLFYSAIYTGEQEEKLALSIGAEVFVVKPTEPEELWEKTCTIMQAWEARKKIPPHMNVVESEEDYLREYGRIVATKLENKVRELEVAMLLHEQAEDELSSVNADLTREITERKRSEEALRESEARLSLTLEVSQAGRWEWDIERDELFFDARFHTMLGYTPGELPTTLQEWLPYHHPEDVPIWMPKAQACLHGDSPGYESEHRIRNKAGTWNWVFTRGKIVDRTTTGSPKLFIGFAMDITERKRVETKLNEQLHFQHQLLESIPIPVYYKDVEGLYLGCNAAFEASTRLSRKDIVGKTVHEVAPKERADMHHEADLALLRHPGMQIYEVSGIYKDGKHHDVIFNKATFVDANDCVAGIVGTQIDITERKQAEEERKKIEAQLRQAQKMESIGTLAGDFNNILTAIVGYGYLSLMQMGDDDPHRENIELMLEGADRAAHLTKDLLLFSRKEMCEKTPVDLNEIVRMVEKFLMRIIGEDISCSISLHGGPILVYADSHQIEQVIMNLATNARDAMPEGGKLMIGTEETTIGKDFVAGFGYGIPGRYGLMTITDTGAGMDEETRKRIFEPFFTTKEVGKGTGLGLAVAYGIIRQHDGYINVYSEPGAGTTFRIYLPIISSEAQREEIAPKEEVLPQGRETILLAEDDDAARGLMNILLKQAGYTVIKAVDGKDAVKKFMQNRETIQLLISDLLMPHMSGKEAYDEMTAWRPELKAIFVSGYAPDEIREKMRLECGILLISKPISPKALLRKVRSVLDEGDGG
jgi:two-component system cell cycle sensor histidine kinase/response regulator CckA